MFGEMIIGLVGAGVGVALIYWGLWRLFPDHLGPVPRLPFPFGLFNAEQRQLALKLATNPCFPADPNEGSYALDKVAPRASLAGTGRRTDGSRP